MSTGKRRGWVRAAEAAAVAGVSLLALWILTPAPTAQSDDPFLRRTAAVRVVERVGPSVVNITTEYVVERSPFRAPLTGDPFFDRWFNRFAGPQGRPSRRTAHSLGSGVLIDAKRHVLTNDHVVRQASAIYVTLADGREFEATLVGSDPSNDLAILRVETDETLPWIPPGRSDDLLVGEPVIAIGNPQGLSNSVTTGVISAVDRSVRTSQEFTFHGFIQTDAAINPGNSGGPLLNAEGTLIGINAAILQESEGIGFAIPMDVAKRVIDELIREGEVAPTWVGLEFQNLDRALHAVLRLPEGLKGVLVNGVAKSSPAAKAGLRRGDIVTHMDGRALRDASDFYSSFYSVRTGQPIELALWRDGEELRKRVHAEALPRARVVRLAEARLGLSLGKIKDGGATVTAVRRGSAAERVGFRGGDRILAINGRSLRNDEALWRAVGELRWHRRAQLAVERDGGRYHVTVPLG